MKRIELDVEHLFKGKFVGRHRIKNDRPFAVLGGARDADIRLLGDDACTVHAVLEFREDGWYLCDLGSSGGTWVQKKPVLEYHIKKMVQVQIGGHTIKIIPKEIENELFTGNENSKLKPGPALDGKRTTFHQVVVRRRGFVVGTHLLDPGEKFEFHHGGITHSLVSPQDKNWIENQFGEVQVQQRLANSEVLNESEVAKITSLWDPNLRGPLVGVLMLFILMISLVGLVPEAPEEELITQKPAKNKYTRIIFDAKKVKKNKAQSKKISKKIAGRSRSVNKPSPSKASGSKKSGGKQKVAGSRTVKSIRASGLGALIGKISKRASKRAVFIEATGKSADNKASGAALGSGGATSVANAGVKTGGIGKGKKIGGVKTAGKGGGSKSYRGIAGLSAGNIGSATVGVLEEETDVQGGLDRDVISRIIKSQIGQIRYCYERQLSANPDLYGKVQVKFTIGSRGGVTTQNIGTSSLNNAMVEGCILRRIAGWQFPQPKGGTNVVVTYPFLFKSTR